MTAGGQGHVRYGDLLDLASASLDEAATSLYRSPLGSVEEAQASVAAHQDLLAALGEQLRWLYRPQLGVGDNLHGTTHLRDGAAMALLAELEAVGKPADWDMKAQYAEGSAAALARASREVRAAADLVATHVDILRTPRTPDALRVFDPDGREDAVLALARLSGTAGRLRGSLELRLHELARQQPGRALPSLPETEAVVEIAEGVVIASRDTPSSDSLGLLPLGLARPPLRSESAANELADRIARLRRVAWELPDRDHVGVSTLNDYAALGVITHAHAIATLTAVVSEDGLPCQQVLEPYRNAHQHWLSIRQQLLPMRTATPAMQGVRADVLAVKLLLETIAPIPKASSPLTAVEPDPTTVEVVLDATRPMSEIAEWNGKVIGHLASQEELLIRARAITGAELSERLPLAEASLRDAVVPAPGSHVVQLLSGLRHLAREIQHYQGFEIVGATDHSLVPSHR